MTLYFQLAVWRLAETAGCLYAGYNGLTYSLAGKLWNGFTEAQQDYFDAALLDWFFTD